MANNTKWLTPFMKQVLVALGASINMSEFSLVIGYTARLLPQLKKPDSDIPIDDDLGSWIAAVLGPALIIGNCAVAAVMGKFGRKPASLVAMSLNLIGWIWISLATNVIYILIARTIQGFALGMISILSPITIGEYTSPENRPAFIAAMLFICSTQTLMIHTLGSYLHWQMAALVAAFISFIGLVILIYCPESPSWLADRERYDDCRKVFRWLRGENKEEELNELIEARKLEKQLKPKNIAESFSKTITKKLRKWKNDLQRREFYLPVIIMFHLFTLSQWSGLNVVVAFTEDLFFHIVGPNINFNVQIIALDIVRIISNILGIYIAKRFTRKVHLFSTVGLNICVLLLISLYSYLKSNNILPWDHQLIGTILTNTLIFSVTIGASPVPYIISGEIFPLEFRSFIGGLCNTFLSFHYFIMTKTFLFCLQKWGLHGTTLLYAVITAYCLIIPLILLPETKNKTLQCIENEWKRTRKSSDDGQSGIPLKTLEDGILEVVDDR